MRQQYSTQLAITAGVLILIATAVFSLVQSPELLAFKEAAAMKSAPPVPHPFAGRRNCRDCHALRSMIPYPLKHAGWSNESCPRCHAAVKAVAPAVVAPLPGHSPAATIKDAARSMPHGQEEMENCIGCHGFDGELPYPADHSGRKEDGCPACHKPATAKGAENTRPSQMELFHHVCLESFSIRR